MQSWLSPGVEDGPSSLVDPDVAAVDDVEGPGSPEAEDGEGSEDQGLNKLGHDVKICLSNSI